LWVGMAKPILARRQESKLKAAETGAFGERPLNLSR
jgi:hypothetical protein